MIISKFIDVDIAVLFQISDLAGVFGKDTFDGSDGVSVEWILIVFELYSSCLVVVLGNFTLRKLSKIKSVV